MAQISVSASKNESGVNVTLCNLDSRAAADVSLTLEGLSINSATGRVLTHADMHAHNTFDNPTVVQPAALTGITTNGAQVSLQLPPMSVAAVTIR